MRTNELQLNIFDQRKESKLLNGILYAIIVVLIALIILFNLVALCSVSGLSMYPSLNDKENVLLLNTKNVKKGDIVVFETDKPLIKRIIASEHDRLVFALDKQGNVGVYLYQTDSFKRLNEPYIFESMRAEWFYQYEQFYLGKYKLLKVDELANSLESITDSSYIIEIEDDSYFVMGDNREHSSDSRTIGQIKRQSIYGKLIHKLKPNSFLENLFLFLYGDKQAQ